jgi:hypothetical protein
MAVDPACQIELEQRDGKAPRTEAGLTEEDIGMDRSKAQQG